MNGLSPLRAIARSAGLPQNGYSPLRIVPSRAVLRQAHLMRNQAMHFRPAGLRLSLHTSSRLSQANDQKATGDGEKDPTLSTSSDLLREEGVEEEKRRRTGVLNQIREVMLQKRGEFEPRIKQHLDDLGKRWNAYSGYEEVVEAKALVLEAEVELKELRERQAVVRQAYVDAVARRAQSQKTLNDLLTRKSTWNEDELGKYTQLLRSEHGDAQNERDATQRFEQMANRVNSAWDDVVRKTLDRYHKEQIWSDRVRAGSTYGSLIIAGLNVFIFILAFLVVEPYKRKKLAQTFESRLLQGEEVNAQMLANVLQDFQQHVERLEEHDTQTNKGVSLLLAKAGIKIDEQGNRLLDEPSSGDAMHDASSSSRPQQTIKEKRRDLAMAGALGFAIGAGLLASFGALQS